MPRPLRWIPEGGALVEVTCRTLQGRFLLRPSRRLNEIIVGILARAKRMYEVELCALIFTANHYHLLTWVPNAKVLASFMNYVNSNLAREAGRLAEWREKFWSRRYRAIVISDEEVEQVKRLKYVLSNGAKEGLVIRPQDWPGLHCIKALLEGEPLQGYWFDRTKEYAARNRGEDFEPFQYATPETLTLDPLPCWKGLTADQIQACAAELVAQIEAEAPAAQEGCEPLGVAAILSQDPHNRPCHSKKSPAPRFHAATREAFLLLYQGYSSFVSAFRDAAEKLRRGDLTVRFPVGSFPPPRAFIEA
jgi:REP element-mobilizing transposase RayT